MNVGITALLHQQGRRVVLVFTDGVDAPMNFSSNNSSLKDVMKRAEEENVMVYAIGLAGSSGFGRGSGGGYGRRGAGGGWRRPARRRRRIWRRRRGGFGGGGRGMRRRARGAQSDKPDEGLPKIAAATGGGYFELTSHR